MHETPLETAGLYHAIFDASPDGVLVVDEEGIVRALNPAACELFGYAEDEVVGRSVELLVPEPLREQHVVHRRAYAADPKPRPMGIGMELQGRRKDGSTCPVEISLSPLETGEGTYVIATVRDVSERLRLRRLGVGSLQAAEEERRRIARELHDDTAQALAGILVRLKIVERTDNARLRHRILQEMHDEVTEAVEGVRRISRGLRPPALEDVGVLAAIRSHLRSFLEASHLTVHLETDPVDDRLAPEEALVLYRVVQEAVTNVTRHAQASTVRVQIRAEEQGVRVIVEDDGVGFDPASPQVIERGLGLVGMRERASAVGGTLLLRSRPGRGTTVILELPGRSSPRDRA